MLGRWRNLLLQLSLRACYSRTRFMQCIATAITITITVTTTVTTTTAAAAVVVAVVKE